MNSITERKMASILAKTLTSMCIRNTKLENIHAGKGIITKNGDYSDVRIIDANGNEIPWNEASRINDEEMKDLMKQIANRIFTFFIQYEDPRFQEQIDYYRNLAKEWDEPKPEIDPDIDCSNR